jgi:hypothetical protein
MFFCGQATSNKAARDRARLAEEAKAIVAMAIRNGPIEGLHSRISQDEMKRIVKTAADRVYSLLWFREKNPERYAALLEATKAFTSSWDEPELTAEF